MLSECFYFLLTNLQLSYDFHCINKRSTKGAKSQALCKAQSKIRENIEPQMGRNH